MRRSGSLLSSGGSLAAACALVAQLLFASAALALPFGDSSAVFCATSTGDGGTSGAPAAPTPKHHNGLCCVVHHGSTPGPAPRPFTLAFEREVAPFLFTLKFSKLVLPAAPELAPSEARAPPGSLS